MQVSAIREEGNGLPVKSPACAYVGSNPTPATHNPRSGPVCGPGLMRVRERFRGPFTVSAGQLWARSGQVSGLCPARPALGGGRGLRIGDRSLRRGVPAGHGPAAGACRVPLSPAASHCGQLCADAWRTESGRVITGFRGPAAGHMACPVTGIEPGHWRSRKVSTARRQGCALSAYRRIGAADGRRYRPRVCAQIIRFCERSVADTLSAVDVQCGQADSVWTTLDFLVPAIPVSRTGRRREARVSTRG
jgi:hypothetical protein